MNRKFIIFYISRYSGHYHAAKAIEGALRCLDSRSEIRVINAFDYTNPILGKVINKAYIEVVKKKPDFFFRNSEESLELSDPQKISAGRMRSFFEFLRY